MRARKKAYFNSGGGFVFNRTITANTAQFNLKDAATAAGWNGTDPLFANITVAAGVSLYGTSAAAAFDTGAGFPTGTLLSLTVLGTVIGVGGGGGPQGSPGNPGGTGLRAQYPIDVTNLGLVAGGGGGGGAGGYIEAWSTEGGVQQIIIGSSGNGGIGAGAVGSITPGAGTAGGYAIRGETWVQGGAGGRGGEPGASGLPGGAFSTNGSAAASTQPTAGGAAGSAITGGEFVKWSTFGDVRGRTEYGTNSVIPTPAATPAISSAFQGGFYANTIWAMVTKIAGAVRISTDATTNYLTAYIEGMLNRPLFYVGQELRISSESSPSESIRATVTGTNSSTVALTILGDASSLAGKTDVYLRSRYRIIVSGKAGEFQGKLFDASDVVPNVCLTLTNGNIAGEAITNSSLVEYVNNLTIGGYDDWYIGARDEIELAYRAFKPTFDGNYTQNNRAVSSLSYATLGGLDRKGTQTGLNMELASANPQNSAYATQTPSISNNGDFWDGEAQALEYGSAVYLSTSKFSENEIWAQRYATGEAGRQVPVTKDTVGYVRAIRRSII